MSVTTITRRPATPSVQSLLAQLQLVPALPDAGNEPAVQVETLDSWTPATNAPSRLCWICWADPSPETTTAVGSGLLLAA